MIFEQVKKIIIETTNCDEAKVLPESSLVDDLELDSLDAVELVMAVEEAFKIRMGDEVMENLKTVSDIVRHVQSNQ